MSKFIFFLQMCAFENLHLDSDFFYRSFGSVVISVYFELQIILMGKARWLR